LIVQSETVVRPHDSLEPVLANIREFLVHQGRGSRAVQKRMLALLASQAAAEDRVRQDYTGRYLMELLQNAHDACAEANHVGSVHFVLTRTALLVANEGVEFDEVHIESLVQLGISEKAEPGRKRQTIGYKGIGFSSVFEITDTPQVIGCKVAFSFDRQRAWEVASEHFDIEPTAVPIRPFPFRIDPQSWADDAREVDKLFERGAVTVIRLPLKAAEMHPDVVASLGESLAPEVLLFSPHLNSVTVSGEGIEKTSWRRTASRRYADGQLMTLRGLGGERRSWLVARGETLVDRTLIERLEERLWQDVEKLSFAVALPWRGGIDSTRREMNVHVYYPTDDKLDRGVLVHGDFFVSSNRRRVETAGAGGKISLVVAKAAAEALAQLAESVAPTQGAALLRALAPTGSSSGFGRQLGEALDAALREAKIVRTADGKTARPIDVVVFDGAKLSTSSRDEFECMFGKQPDLAKTRDGDSITIPFVESLGATMLDPTEAAARITETPSSHYVARLAALGEWLDSNRDRHGRPIHRALIVLKRKPLLVDTANEPLEPARAVLQIGNVPQLPKKLQRREVRPVRTDGAREVLTKLGVEELTLESAVALVLRAIEGGDGQSGQEAMEVLDFFRAVWRRRRSVLEKARGLSRVRVPVRKASGGDVHWVNASNAYFSKAWLGNDNLERVYGSFDEYEFLAVEPPKRGVSRDREFFKALGVWDEPARLDYRSNWDHWISLHDYNDWRYAVDPGRAGACADHLRSQVVTFTCIDRLDDILWEELSVRRATALATLLARSSTPLGTEAVLECTHTSHRRRRHKAVNGYQSWLLSTNDWVPTRGIDGKTVLAPPHGSWRNVIREYTSYAIPRAALPSATAQALGLPAPTSPRLDAIKYLIRQLAERYPNLPDASPTVAETARWAQQQLDRLVRSHAPRTPDVPLVAKRDGQLEWSKEPWVPDAPGVHLIPGLPLVEGRCGNLRSAYRLRSAREDLQIEVEPAPRLSRGPYLDRYVKAALLAFLDARNADRDQVAARLARLDDRALEHLTLRVSYDGQSVSVPRQTYIEIRRNRSGAIIGGTHYWSGKGELNPLYLSEELAHYLGDPELAEPIALLLSNRNFVLDRYQISDADLNLAGGVLAEALRRARKDDAEDAPSVCEVHDDEPTIEPEEQLAPEPDGTGSQAAAVTTAAETARSNGAQPRPSNGRSTPIDASRIRQALGTLPSGSPDTSPPEALPLGQLEFGQPTTPSPGERAERERLARQQRPRVARWAVDGSGGGGFMSSERDVEAEAIEIVKRYATTFGAVQVNDVQSENRGWDLEFVLADGQIIPIEVKGSRTDTAFMITRREREAAALDEYWLFWVINIRNPAATRIRRFRAPGKTLTDEDMNPLSWVVDGWQRLDYDEVPIRIVEGALPATLRAE
jgi:hypothetical protein